MFSAVGERENVAMNVNRIAEEAHSISAMTSTSPASTMLSRIVLRS